jgi:tricorn protease
MTRLLSVLVSALTFIILTTSGSGPALGAPPETRLLRFPDIHNDFVVFVYAGDIWRVPSAGGTARRLTAHEGVELFPRISPDGRLVAYTAEYTGTRQVYVMPSEGGAPTQLTFYTDVGAMPPRGGWDYWIVGWTPDGEILVRMNRTPWGVRMGRYHRVDPRGGLERPLPLPHGGSASLSPDGNKIAYTPVDREFRTWKRTRGGRAQDIWIYDLVAGRSERITDFEGTDNFPMWAGDRLYFTSDRSDTLNLFVHDLEGGGEKRQVTRFDEYDVLWPALGPDAIVFMNGGHLYRISLDTEKYERIPITLGGDLPLAVPHFKEVEGNVESAAISPNGARAVFEARGELFSVPAKDGPTRNLTRTQGTRERAPSWSPDGRWIAYLSDASGEYEIWVRAQDGSGEPRQITKKGEVWRFEPVWSPDSEMLVFGDRARRLWVLEVASGHLTEIDRGTLGDLDTYVWSPDGRWLVYEQWHASRVPGLALYSLDQKRSFMLGDGMTNDYDPAFSADGKHLFFLSDRDYPIEFSAFEFNYLYSRATRVFAAALDPDAPPLFPLESDEQEIVEDDAEPVDETEDEEDGDAKAEPIAVEPHGFVDRTVGVPGVTAADYAGLTAIDGALVYMKSTGNGFALYRYDLGKREEEKILDSVQAYDLSADGKKLLYLSGGNWGITDIKPGLQPGEEKLDLSGLRVKIDPRAEWNQMFDDAWRIGRDWFYDPDMHGMDWEAIGKRYRALVPFVAHRGDLDFILGEMISELEAGHAYVQSGDMPEVKRVPGGALGCEFDADSDRYRIARIYRGENWDNAYRSPLTEPGVNVSVGDYVLAIDGVELTVDDNPFRLLEGKANAQVVLTVNDRPSLDDAREETVHAIGSEQNLRYIDWVKSRMEMTDRLSNGRVGYIHLPNTAIPGNRMLQKLFYSQADKEALIIDDRYNGGGFIPDRMIEYFSRTTLAYWARRDVESMRTPGFAHDGPKVMLMNAYSSSGGDALPFFFRKNGLGQLIGTRTWGGLIGLTGAPSLVDGGTVLYPTFRLYDTDGEWAVENVGVAPDIEVFDLPEKIAAGGDPSLEKGVEVLLEELKRGRFKRPSTPEPPDMSR